MHSATGRAREARRQQRPKVGGEAVIAQLLREILLEHRPRHGMALVVHVLLECGDDASSIDVVPPKREVEVEEVAPLLALVERAQLGCEQLVGRQK